MRYVLDASQMQQVDKFAIEDISIPSMVLMERAALAVSDAIRTRFTVESKILVVCGIGNNGADGVAVARILKGIGYDIDIFLVEEGKASEELKHQILIARRLGVKFVEGIDLGGYEVVVDAIFGIGLSRPVEGKFEQVIEAVNSMKAYVVAVDIPSGINATSGQILKNAVKANVTVTFGYEKTGLLLFPGAEYAGEVILADIGFPKENGLDKSHLNFTLSKEDLLKLPKRKADSHKGTYGKVLVIAGSKTCVGAAVLSAKAALKSGCGMVNIFTYEDNRAAIAGAFPESLITTYGDELDWTVLKNSMDWADSIVIGPGIGTGDLAKAMVGFVMENSEKTTVIDADAINIIAENKALLKKVKGNFIFTPHILEMSRLTGISVQDIKTGIIDVARLFAITNKCVCILKDVRSIVAKSSQKVYINIVGNSGMATAGSGDVLTGIVAAMAAYGLDAYKAACYGTLIHGLSGDCATIRLGEHSVIAGDIIDSIHEVFKQYGKVL